MSENPIASHDTYDKHIIDKHIKTYLTYLSRYMYIYIVILYFIAHTASSCLIALLHQLRSARVRAAVNLRERPAPGLDAHHRHWALLHLEYTSADSVD